MKVDAKYSRVIQDACEDALVLHGFRRLRRDGIVYELTEDFLGWVGLNVGKHGSFIRINPFVGVHCISVMKLISDLSDEPYQVGRYATFSVSLGEICPKEDTFDFSPPESPESEAGRLANVYLRYGLPFVSSYVSYEAILQILMARVPMLGGYPQRVAATLYLMGKQEEAIQFVTDRRVEYESDPVVGRDFERFAGPFMKMVTS